MDWGWIDTVEEVQRRLTNFEAEVRGTGSLPELHEIETMPCLSQDRSGTDMVQTHSSDVNRVYAVPFRFSGQIYLQRISAICAATAGNTSSVGLCLYMLDDPSRVNQLSPRTGSTPRLRKIGSGGWTDTDGADNLIVRATYGRGVYLSTSNGLFFAGWTCTEAEGTVFCPNSGPGSLDAAAGKSFLSSFTTTGTASPSTGFPDTLTITGSTDVRAAPCVIGRSLTGLRIYGSFTDDT